MTDLMRRTFTEKERAVLLGSSGGRCAICGSELRPGWHADHIEPFSAGGVTDVHTNAQALCPGCNLEKGARATALPGWSSDVVLRDWQQEAFTMCYGSLIAKQHSMLVVACPAAGKTIFAARLVHALMAVGRIDRVLVIAPSKGLKAQWANALATSAKIQLQPTYQKDQPLTSGFAGWGLTYQAVSQAEDTDYLLRWVQDGKTLVICDEIHHVGENRAWSKQLQKIGERAKGVLALSGTPFRTDGMKIPFIHYDESGRCLPDFTYGLRRAFQDRVICPVMFPSSDGAFEWIDGSGKVQQASFVDEVPDYQAKQRLRAALSMHKNWLPRVLERANERISQIRSGYGDERPIPNAAGLVTCIDVTHANQIAEFLFKLTGERPLVIHNEEELDQNWVKQANDGGQRWIVSVRMVSEGVDIRRLRVGVYATNIQTRVFFVQFVGRFLRGDGVAAVFIPNDKYLVEFAKEIAADLDWVIEQRVEETNREVEERGSTESEFMPLSATLTDEHVIHGEDQIDARYIALARADHPSASQLVIEMVASSLQRHAYQAVVTSSQQEHVDIEPKEIPLFEQQAQEAADVQARTEYFGRMLNKVGQISEDKRAETNWAINKYLVRQTKKKKSECSLYDLQRRKEILSRWIARLTQEMNEGRGYTAARLFIEYGVFG